MQIDWDLGSVDGDIGDLTQRARSFDCGIESSSVRQASSIKGDVYSFALVQTAQKA